MSMADSRWQRIATLCGLYGAQGLPWGFMTIALISYLTAQGVNEARAGELAAIVLVPWTFKLIWAPLIDTVTIRSMGRRRPWIIGAELMMAVTLLGLLLMGNLEGDLQLLGWMFFLHNCFASLQDVATDALAVDILPRNEYGQVNGLMWGSKLVGKGIGAGLMAVVMNHWGIAAAVLVQFTIMVVIMLLPLLLLERSGEKRFPWSRGRASGDVKAPSVRSPWEVLRDMRQGFALSSMYIFAILGVTKTIGYGVTEIVNKTLYTQRLGWSSVDYSVVSAYAVVPEFIGAIGAGFLADRFGRRRVMGVSMGASALLALLFGALPGLWSTTWFTTLYLVLAPALWAVVGVSFLSFSMRITWTRSAATIFTTYMTLSNVGHVIGNWMAGPVRETFSFEHSFMVSGLMIIVPILLLPLVRPAQVDRARRLDETMA